jgi:septum formation protein
VNGEGRPREAVAPGWGARLLGLGERRLVLASASPRRASILEALGVRFEVRLVRLQEGREAGETPAQTCLRLARAKAVAAGRKGEDALVLGADTVVVLDGEVLGKPRDDREAEAMLQRLSGRVHIVLTALALLRARDGAMFTGVEETRVRFLPLSREDIEALVASGEPMDKAGAYGIQGSAAVVVERIEGDYYNVVGLPLARLRRVIGEATQP